jgi:hypothetical protein
MQEEKWRRIKGWPYIVSSYGRIARYGSAQGTSTGKILKPKISNTGYAKVCLRRDGDKWYARIHRLVADAFIGPCPPGHQINHIDGDKLNNRSDNLEWATQSENMAHAAQHGLRPRGESHKLSKLDEVKVREIRERHAGGETYAELSRAFNIDPSVIRGVVRRESWKHVQ